MRLIEGDPALIYDEGAWLLQISNLTEFRFGLREGFVHILGEGVVEVFVGLGRFFSICTVTESHFVVKSR